jgi:hypothetical protein
MQRGQSQDLLVTGTFVSAADVSILNICSTCTCLLHVRSSLSRTSELVCYFSSRVAQANAYSDWVCRVGVLAGVLAVSVTGV